MAGADPMRVAVAIVGFRNRDDILACLKALAASTYTDFLVVICENGGEAAHAALAAALAPPPLAQEVRLLRSPANVGYAGGVNACIAAAPDADAWWVLNPDTSPERGALAALVAAMRAGPYDGVGGVLYEADGAIASVGLRWRPWLARVERLGGGVPATPAAAAAAAQRMNVISGACMLINRAFLKRAGPMRDDYFLYAEEVEWFCRAARRGLRLGIAPDARVLHNQGSTTGSATTARDRPRLPVYLDERNRLNVVRDTQPLWLLTAVPATLALLTLRYGRRRAWRQWRWAAAGWWAGVRNRRGVPDWMLG